MNKFLTLFTIVILTAASANAQSQATYSLEECIQYALEHNAKAANAKLDVNIAESRIDEYLADGYPQINGSVDLGYNFKIQSSFIQDFISPAVYGVLFQEGVIPERDLGEPATFPAQFGTKYTGTGVVSLTQMVFNGSFFVGLKAARTYTDLSRKQYQRTEIEISEAVTKAYYLVLINRELFTQIDQNYARLDTLLKQTQVMYDNGFAEKIDVDRIKVQFNNISVERNNFQKAIDLSLALLKFQMGMSPKEPIELGDKIEDIKLEVLSENFGEDFKYDDRIEYDILQTNRELVGIDIKNTAAKYYPTIDLYGRYGANTGVQEFGQLFDFGDRWFTLGAVGLQMNIPIFDGMRKSRQIQQKRFQAQQLENNLQQLQQSIDVEIQQAETKFTKSLDNFRTQQENMTLAENIYNTTRIKYQEGVGSNLEVVEADTSLKDAQYNYYNALYEVLVAKVEMEKAYGKLQTK